MIRASLPTRMVCAFLVFVVTIVVVGWGAAAAADRRSPVIYSADRVATAAEAAAALLDQARQRGSVRVIVEMRDVAGIAASPETASPDAAAPDASGAAPALNAAEEARLRSAQNTLLADLVAPMASPSTSDARSAAPAIRAVTLFKSIPFVALNANATVIRRLLDHAQVASVQEDRPVPPQLAQSVPLTGATQAWKAGYDGTGQVVAVIDTGVAKGHPMLAGKVVSEACYSTTDAYAGSLCPRGVSASTAVNSGVNCATSITGCEHGTHVASIAVGNAAKLKGMAPGAKLISIKVFSRFASAYDCGPQATPCALAYWSDIIQGLERVYALRSSFHIAAVNVSAGSGLFPSNCSAESPALAMVINNLRKARIATVVAAGNDGANGEVAEPACIPAAVAVGSTTKGDTVSTFSNLSQQVDLMAPGTNIRAAVPGGGFRLMSGTSMAAPHVTGAWAILMQAKPSAGVSAVQSALACTGKPVSRAGITKPRIDVMPALTVLKSPATGCS